MTPHRPAEQQHDRPARRPDPADALRTVLAIQHTVRQARAAAPRPARRRWEPLAWHRPVTTSPVSEGCAP